MNAVRAAWDYHLRNVMIVWYGAHLAGLLAALILVVQGETWAAALVPALMVACIAGVMLAVVALWGIRYPRPVKADPRKPESSIEDTQPTRRIPRIEDGYQALAKLPPVYLPPIPKKKLRMIFISLKRDGDLALSVDKLKKAARANEKEVAVIREWFKRRELTEDYRAGVRLVGAWREEIDKHLPYCEEAKSK